MQLSGSSHNTLLIFFSVDAVLRDFTDFPVARCTLPNRFKVVGHIDRASKSQRMRTGTAALEGLIQEGEHKGSSIRIELKLVLLTFIKFPNQPQHRNPLLPPSRTSYQLIIKYYRPDPTPRRPSPPFLTIAIRGALDMPNRSILALTFLCQMPIGVRHLPELARLVICHLSWLAIKLLGVRMLKCHEMLLEAPARNLPHQEPLQPTIHYYRHRQANIMRFLTLRDNNLRDPLTVLSVMQPESTLLMLSLLKMRPLNSEKRFQGKGPPLEDHRSFS